MIGFVVWVLPAAVVCAFTAGMYVMGFKYGRAVERLVQIRNGYILMEREQYDVDVPDGQSAESGRHDTAESEPAQS